MVNTFIEKPNKTPWGEEKGICCHHLGDLGTAVSWALKGRQAKPQAWLWAGQDEAAVSTMCRYKEKLLAGESS